MLEALFDALDRRDAAMLEKCWGELVGRMDAHARKYLRPYCRDEAERDYLAIETVVATLDQIGRHIEAPGFEWRGIPAFCRYVFQRLDWRLRDRVDKLLRERLIIVLLAFEEWETGPDNQRPDHVALARGQLEWLLAVLRTISTETTTVAGTAAAVLACLAGAWRESAGVVANIEYRPKDLAQCVQGRLGVSPQTRDSRMNDLRRRLRQAAEQASGPSARARRGR